MQEPSVRTSRLAIAGGLAAAIAIGGIGFLVGRATMPAPLPPKAAIVVPPVPAEPAGSKVQPLSRGDIVTAAAQAADAVASGSAPPGSLADLPGRRFSLSLPFGCAGPAGADSPAPLRWRYDDATQTLRIHVALIVWQPDEWAAAPDATAVPQGFWVTRPWSSAETCPATSREPVATGIEPVLLPGQTLAIVNFTADAPPSNNGYEAVVRIPREKLDMVLGLRARITGRIDHVPGTSGAIRCIQPGGSDQQPICAVAAIFDELAVDNPATGQTVATWTLGKAGEAAR